MRYYYYKKIIYINIMIIINIIRFLYFNIKVEKNKDLY